MKPTGRLIVFKLAKTNDRVAMNRFCRRFYGYLDHSHNDKYRYQRKGFLDDFPHLKLQSGVIVVRRQNTRAILSFLKEYNSEIFMRDIILTKRDLKLLGMESP
jgi:hypothetical protein